MSARTSPQPEAAQQPYRRLKLVLSTSENQQGSSPIPIPNREARNEESSSPARPSYSPVTPTLSHTSGVGLDASEPEWVDEPEPLPISLDDNPDAIALKATLSLLQMQRQQSLKDIRTLNRIRLEALDHPEAFVDDLKEGKLSKVPTAGVTFESEEEGEEENGEADEGTKQERVKDSRFGKLPIGQNIVRCPPIEWSKYRIVGEPLDRLHELQRQHPGITEDNLSRETPTKRHEIVAPYNPFTDKVNPVPNSNEFRNYER